jgi:nitrite reductase/ring-hydroxylating ferredoxin subunit
VTKPTLVNIGNLDQLYGDGPHVLSVNGLDVVVMRTPAGLRAFEGRCPHQGARLAEGELEGDKLVCRNHGWRFNVESGKREGGSERLVSCPIVERDRALFLDVSALSVGPPRISATRTLDDLAGPRGIPFLGNIHQLDMPTRHLTLERWAAQYGAVDLF